MGKWGMGNEVYWYQLSKIIVNRIQKNSHILSEKKNDYLGKNTRDPQDPKPLAWPGLKFFLFNYFKMHE